MRTYSFIVDFFFAISLIYLFHCQTKQHIEKNIQNKPSINLADSLIEESER